MYASKQAPFLITETNAGAIGGAATNFPAFDGQWRQAAWAFVARGAEMIEYWHWHTTHFGTETYWVGILPHDQQPGRVYAELSRLGAEFRTAGAKVVGLTPDAEVGLLYSARSKWGLAFQAAFPKPGTAAVTSLDDVDQRSYPRIFEAFYRGTFDAGVSARLLHDSQIVGPDGVLLDPAALAAELPVLIVPGLLVAGDELLWWLRAYAAAGGHLVLGPRTAYGDEEGRARIEVKPAHLAEVAGRALPGVLQPLRPGCRHRGERRLRPIGRRRGRRLGRRPDHRRVQDHPRLRPSPLRPVPRGGVHRARPGPDHHGGDPAQCAVGGRPVSLAGPGSPEVWGGCRNR